jgi:hypothetical protein
VNVAIGGRVVALCLAALVAQVMGVAAQQPPLGTRPTYTTRTLTPAPNAQAVTARIWVPGLDDGYVPQGVTMVGGDLYVASYRSLSGGEARGPCRIYRLNPATGQTTGQLDLPPACGHAGGLARGPAGRIYVADTRAVFEITLHSGATLGEVTRTTKLAGAVKGSFAAGTADALWLGSYEREGPGVLYRMPHAALQQSTIRERHATGSVVLPSKSQGAAFDVSGQLWITRSGSTLGELLQLDAGTGEAGTGAVQARYQMPAGIEDLTFDAAGFIWTLSEAGSRRWNTWQTFQPILFQLDPKRLVR